MKQGAADQKEGITLTHRKTAQLRWKQNPAKSNSMYLDFFPPHIIWCIITELTLSVCGTADDICELGLQAGVGGVVLSCRLVSSGAQRQHTLQGCVGPQTLALMYGQRRGVVNKKASVLKRKKK